MSDKQIRIVRKRQDAGEGMYRVYCEACRVWCQGRGKSAYQTYWVALVGAERAADTHQTQHEAQSFHNGKRRNPMQGNDVCLNGEYENIAFIPTVSAFAE